MSQGNVPWYKQMSRYHWFVFMVCALGWGFDTLDQQLFALARADAVADLTGSSVSSADARFFADMATALMLVGWGTGGILFGIMADKLGRAKTMIFTILVYSIFTGLSGLSYGAVDFIIYRFLTGLGVGGQFAASATLLAESMPDAARARTLGLLQIIAAMGNMLANVIAMAVFSLGAAGMLPVKDWRFLFLLGVLPALLSVVVMRYLKEPEKWTKAVAEGDAGKKAGSISDLFGTPRWRKNVILGMILASTGIIGLWGIFFYSGDLTQMALKSSDFKAAIENGENADDVLLVSALVASPELGEEFKRLQGLDENPVKIGASDLIGSDLKTNDPAAVYKAYQAMYAASEGGAASDITPESILAWLDSPPDGAKMAPQSAEVRERRAAMLADAKPMETTAFAELASKISDRASKINGNAKFWKTVALFLFNFGAVIGTYAFTIIAVKIGRRPTFSLFFIASFVITIVVFLTMDTTTDVLWMQPLAGFCVLSLFGGYAIYFPELFPTHLRGTAISFCYNIARFIAAVAPMALTFLTVVIFGSGTQAFRNAGAVMSVIFLIGLIVTWLGPETKDQPLPE